MSEQNEGGEYIHTELHDQLPVDEPRKEIVAPPPYDPEELEKQRDRLEVRRDLLAVNAIAAYCVYGRPPLSESVRERFRRNIAELAIMVDRTRQIPNEGPARQRFQGVVREAQEKNAEIEAASHRCAPGKKPTQPNAAGRNLRQSSRQVRR